MVDPKEKFEEGQSTHFVVMEIYIFLALLTLILQSARSPKAARQLSTTSMSVLSVSPVPMRGRQWIRSIRRRTALKSVSATLFIYKILH
jgi:hypothetical protein